MQNAPQVKLDSRIYVVDVAGECLRPAEVDGRISVDAKVIPFAMIPPKDWAEVYNAMYPANVTLRPLQPTAA
jgi:hypothetical protein